MGTRLEEREAESAGVRANARLTGAAGALIFVLLAAEGFTILSVQGLLSAHVFIGMLLVPVVGLKTITTGYRFWRYYTGNPPYVRKGPPPIILRLLGPFVVATTVAVLATGIGLLAVGPGHDLLLTAHKASFILWFGAMTLHVLGHILETPALAFADWRRETRRDPSGANIRITALVVSVLVGIVLATRALGWIGAWHRAAGR